MFLAAVLAGLMVLALAVILVLVWMPAMVRRSIQVILTHPMSDTLAELYLSVRSTPPVDFLYSSLRSTTGDMVIRPMGSARPAHGLDDLALNPSQLARHPLLVSDSVELATVIGKSSKRPIEASLPLYLSGMAYGLALNLEARLALAAASGKTRIPLNSGQGPFLHEERARASHFVLQFGRWAWNRDPEILRQADMIEVQVGQGAMPGNAVLATPDEVGPEIKRLMGLGPDEAPIIHSDLFLKDPDHPTPLDEVVSYLRSETEGIPIALKMGAGNDLERDIDVALEAGIDVIVIDGTEGATGNAPITLSDHFGIPTLYALARAVRHLEQRGMRGKVDLLISGGLREPGDFLKACALGADAVGIGTIAMFALAHRQITQTVPLFPPTDLVFYRAKPRIPLDVAMATDGLVNFLESCRKEMETALKTMGHHSIRDLSLDDVCALDPLIAEITGAHFAGHPTSVGPTVVRASDSRRSKAAGH